MPEPAWAQGEGRWRTCADGVITVREALGPAVRHRASRSMNNRSEQDHRGVTQRYYPLRGFGFFASAARFCAAHDELRDHLRPRTRCTEPVSLAEQRRRFQERWGTVCALLQAAWPTTKVVSPCPPSPTAPVCPET